MKQRRAADQGRAAACLVALAIAACTGRPTGVAFVRYSISPEPSELQIADATHSIQLGIGHDGDAAIVEVRIDVPPEVEALWPVRSPGAPFQRICCTWLEPPQGPVRWSGGAIHPGTFQVFAMFVALSDVDEGDELRFPVELVMADGSVVNWNGPPSSTRPAPTLVVSSSLGSGRGLAVSGIVAGAAILVLVSAGVRLLTSRRP